MLFKNFKGRVNKKPCKSTVKNNKIRTMKLIFVTHKILPQNVLLSAGYKIPNIGNVGIGISQTFLEALELHFEYCNLL